MSRNAKKSARRTRKRSQRKLNGIESLESKQLLTAIHVDQADEHPDVHGCGDTTNECDTIMNAMHFANAGDDIVLKPDTYHENVVVTKSVDINSVGGRSTIRPAGGPVAVSTGPGVDVTLRFLNLTGGVSGFDAKGSKHIRMFDVRANGNAMHGISFAGEKLEIHQGEFSRNGAEGIVMAGGDLYMVDTVVESNESHGFRGEALGLVGLDNPRFEANALSGALLAGADSITATDIRAIDNTADGLIIDDTAGTVAITRSWFTGNGADGLIVADTADKASLTNVTATDNGRNGLHVVEASDATIVEGGVFGGNGGNGLDFLDIENLEVRSDGGAKTDANRNGGHGLAVGGAHDVVIEGDFHFNGADGVSLAEFKDATLGNVVAHRNGNEGVLVSSANSVSVHGGRFDLNAANGIHVVDSTEGVTVVDATVVENSESGIAVESTRNVSLTDVTSKGNVDHGIAIEHAHDINVTGGSATANLKSGIAVGIAAKARISGNIELSRIKASDNGADGFSAETVSNVIVRGGEFSKNGGSGIQVADAKRVVLFPHATEDLDANQNGAHGAFVAVADSFSLEGENDTKATFEKNAGNGIALLDIGGDVSIRAVSPHEIVATTNGVNGIAMGNIGGTTHVANAIATVNVTDGVRVVNAAENVVLENSIVDRNGANGVTVIDADRDVNVLGSSASLNSVDGIFVDEVSAKGAATDFKVTVEDSRADANGASGIHIVNVERALIEDSFANNNVAEGIQLAFVSDDVTIKRSEANGNADGILMSNVNDTNLQFSDAIDNAGEGLRSRLGSTIHATGGNYSDNGASGWDIKDSGDVSMFGTSVSSNGDDGLKLDNPGAVNLSSSVITANRDNGFDISGAAWATLSNLTHMRNLSESVVLGTPIVNFTATTGELETKDDVQVATQLSESSERDPIVLSHTRTVVDESGETEVEQDDIFIDGATAMAINGGDGADRLVAADWPVEAKTGLAELEVYGGDGADEIAVAFSGETAILVEGDEPDVAPGDRLTLESTGIEFADDGETMTASEMQDIRYRGIESVEAEYADEEPPTVEIVDVDSSGPTHEITIRFSEPISGLDVNDLQLTRNGVQVDLAEATVLSTDSGLTWNIGNLSDATLKAGDYKMELLANDAAIQDLFGNDLKSGDSMEWTNVPGDANGDGVFDSSDLIAAFVANKYGTGEPASHAEGDWNNDGVFNSSDLIYVFGNGNYAG